MVILDTNIIIDHLRQHAQESLLMKLEKQYSKARLCVSIISIQELYEGRSTIQREKEDQLLSVVTPLKICAYSFEIATLAGKIARDLGIGHPIDIADAAIAATAIVNHCELVTLDQKDFLKIPGLSLHPLFS